MPKKHLHVYMQESNILLNLTTVQLLATVHINQLAITVLVLHTMGCMNIDTLFKMSVLFNLRNGPSLAPLQWLAA